MKPAQTSPSHIQYYRLYSDKEDMEHHPITAVLLCCKTCGLLRVSDNYTAAHARGKAHTGLSGHLTIKYSLIEAPDRLREAQAGETESKKTVKGYVEAKSHRHLQ